VERGLGGGSFIFFWCGWSCQRSVDIPFLVYKMPSVMLSIWLNSAVDWRGELVRLRIIHMTRFLHVLPVQSMTLIIRRLGTPASPAQLFFEHRIFILSSTGGGSRRRQVSRCACARVDVLCAFFFRLFSGRFLCFVVVVVVITVVV